MQENLVENFDDKLLKEKREFWEAQKQAYQTLGYLCQREPELQTGVIARSLREESIKHQVLLNYIVINGVLEPVYLACLSKHCQCPTKEISDVERASVYDIADAVAVRDKQDKELADSSLGEDWYKKIKALCPPVWSQTARSKFETDTRYISDTNVASSSWLASTVYYGEYGLDYGDYWEDSYTPPIDPAKQYNEQLWAHEDSLRDAESIGEFHGSAVKALDFHKALDNQEEDSLAVRIAYSGLYDEENGPCPSLEEMLGIAKGFQVIAPDNVVRPVTDIQVVGYDKYYRSEAEKTGDYTADKHNTLVECLDNLTEEEAMKLTEEGTVILWNAGNSGRHYAVSFDTEEEL